MVMLEAGEAGLDLAVFGVDGYWRKEPGWVSVCYGEKEPAQICVYSANSAADQDLLTFLLPQREHANPSRIKPTSAKGGKAFRVTHDDGLDVVMIRRGDTGEEVETGRLISDALWTWMRFSGEEAESELEEFILLNARKLGLSGKTLFETANKVDYVVGHRINGQLLVETSESRIPVNG